MNNLCYLESTKLYPQKERPKNLAYKKPYLKGRRGMEKTENLFEIRTERQRKKELAAQENIWDEQKIKSLMGCLKVEEKLISFCSGKLVRDNPDEARKISSHIHSCDSCFSKFWDEVELAESPEKQKIKQELAKEKEVLLKTIRLPVNIGWGQSVGNILDFLSGDFRKRSKQKHWIKILEIEPGIFEIIDENITEKYDKNIPKDWIGKTTLLGMKWDEECKLLETAGRFPPLGMHDIADYYDEEVKDDGYYYSSDLGLFGIAQMLRWGEVKFLLGYCYRRKPQELRDKKIIIALSVEEIKKALEHVKFCAYSPADR